MVRDIEGNWSVRRVTLSVLASVALLLHVMVRSSDWRNSNALVSHHVSVCETDATVTLVEISG